MSKATKVITIINCILSSLAFVTMNLYVLEIVDIHFGTAIMLFIVPFYLAIHFEIVAFALSVIHIINEKQSKYLIINLIPFAVLILTFLSAMLSEGR